MSGSFNPSWRSSAATASGVALSPRIVAATLPGRTLTTMKVSVTTPSTTGSV
jgi:hypothetical protein